MSECLTAPDNTAMWDTISYFGETTFRQRFHRFGIKQSDRLSHIYVLGKTGVGKSTLLEVLAQGDLADGRGFALIDPHGDLAERVYRSVPPQLSERVTYLNAPDLSQPFGYNPLRRVREEKIPLAVAGFIETFRKLFPNAWGVRMEHVLRNSLYALLEREGSTLPDILRLYTDKAFRKSVAANTKNHVVRDFWTNEYEKYPGRLEAEAIGPIQNKLGSFLADPRLYRILVDPVHDLRFRSLMDEGRILIVNLSKGQIGEDAALLLGGLLVSTIGLAAFSRAEVSSHDRRPFQLYVDEFQNFTTLSLANMMSELRKYGLGLTLANQYLQQLEPDLRHAVLGNAGTIVSFRIGPEDAMIMSREFLPIFDVEDLLNLPNRHFYLKLMIDGAPSRPFSARTVSPSGYL